RTQSTGSPFMGECSCRARRIALITSIRSSSGRSARRANTFSASSTIAWPKRSRESVIVCSSGSAAHVGGADEGDEVGQGLHHGEAAGGVVVGGLAADGGVQVVVVAE